ncbi:MAG: hypothetical protein GY758_26350 [Fuerstiella sp.]|nr:hypothetical protein [Fuerstiella sp.]MCP4510212.1 hypothetical protein [Fuerstiella sp.]
MAHVDIGPASATEARNCIVSGFTTIWVFGRSAELQQLVPIGHATAASHHEPE